MTTYRDEIAKRLAQRLSGREDAYPEYALADAVLAVPNLELAYATAEVRRLDDLVQRMQARNATYEDLRARLEGVAQQVQDVLVGSAEIDTLPWLLPEECWDALRLALGEELASKNTALATLSALLRGMARRVGAYRRSGQRDRDDAIVLWQRSEDRLSALRAECVVLPEDLRDHVASWGPWCCGDTDQVAGLHPGYGAVVECCTVTRTEWRAADGDG